MTAAGSPPLPEHITDEEMLAALAAGPAGLPGRGSADRCGRVFL